jgi:hypothetical protein
MLPGREVCFGCRKRKRRLSLFCAKCDATTKRHIAAHEKRLKAKSAASA